MEHTTNSATGVVLVVDDTPVNVTVIDRALAPEFEVWPAYSGREALDRCAGDRKPDLIILDVMMPDMDGYEVCATLKNDPATRDIPVMFVTALGEYGHEKQGLDLGATDYITKPVSPALVRLRVRNQLMLKRARDVLNERNAELEREVQKRTRQILAVQNATLIALASLAETRDDDTGHHIKRTQMYVRTIVERALRDGAYTEALADGAGDMIVKTAPLHDIGKVGIPDRILLKPGKLDPHEFEIMKTHCLLGFKAIERARAELETGSEFLDMAGKIALSHHERWDGGGYPHQLAGERIPLAARIMAIADVYDALSSPRVYKPAFDHPTSIGIMEEGRGTFFDPVLLDCFLSEADIAADISRHWTD